MADQTGVFTVRIPTELQDKIDKVAQALERPRSWVVQHALTDFVDSQAWQIEEIKQAVVEADSGDFATDAQIQKLNNKYKKRRS